MEVEPAAVAEVLEAEEAGRAAEAVAAALVVAPVAAARKVRRAVPETAVVSRLLRMSVAAVAI
jgi:hypothetical protein